jgi:hypothetical protein
VTTAAQRTLGWAAFTAVLVPFLVVAGVIFGLLLRVLP